MDNPTVELRQVNVRGAAPLRLEGEEYDTLVFSMLAEGDGLISERLKFFGCPDCRYGFLGSHETKILCDSLIETLPDDYKLAGRVLETSSSACAAMLLKAMRTGKSAPNGKEIKKLCKTIKEWLPKEPVAIRVSEVKSPCRHLKALLLDEDLHGAA